MSHYSSVGLPRIRAEECDTNIALERQGKGLRGLGPLDGLTFLPVRFYTLEPKPSSARVHYCCTLSQQQYLPDYTDMLYRKNCVGWFHSSHCRHHS